MDSPVYRRADSGEEMVRERERAFEQTYGFQSNSVPAEHFLTTDRLATLARELSLKWQTFAPFSSVSRLKGLWRKARGLREFATMPVIAGSRA
jgi:hypothetical protein